VEDRSRPLDGGFRRADQRWARDLKAGEGALKNHARAVDLEGRSTADGACGVCALARRIEEQAWRAWRAVGWRHPTVEDARGVYLYGARAIWWTVDWME